MEQTYKFTFANRVVVDKLDDTPIPKKPIQGVAWYNLLANPLYVRDFNYITANIPGDRGDYIVDDDDEEGNDCEQSDLASILINLAYVKQEVGRVFQFKKNFSLDFGKNI